jgi:hypothetical protein
MSEVVTELRIDADTTGADQFQQSMEKAGMTAQQLVLSVAGVGVAFIATLASLKAFVDYTGTLNKQFVDIQEGAARAGISTREFQEILFAARTKGVTEKDFVAGLDKITDDLTAAGRGVTEFSKLFAANGIAIRQSNGELITTKSALNDIMGLMQNASPAVQRAITGIVGVSKDWIPLLRDGVEKMEAQKRVASEMGLVLGQDVIDKAAVFNTQWQSAIAIWDTKFRSSLAGVMPLMVKLADLAIKVIDGVGAISNFFSGALTPDENKTKTQLMEQIDKANELRNSLSKVNGEWETLRLQKVRGSMGLAEDADISTVDRYIANLKKMADAKKDVARVVANTPGGTVLAPTGSADGNDKVDAAINTLRRHTEQQEADARAIGLGAGALALFRAEAAQTSAVAANGGAITADQAAKFRVLQLAAQDAAIGLEKVRVAYDIKRGRDTAFLSQDDVNIANQLKNLYPDVATAINSVEANSIRANTAFRSMSSMIENNLTTGTTDAISGAKNFGQAMQDTGKLVLRALEEMIVKMMIIRPLMAALGGGGGGGGLFGSLLGGGGGSGIGSIGSIGGLYAQGGAFDGGNVIPFARGGVIDGPMIAPMALMGEAGPEAIVPLRRGADGNLGIAGGGGGSVSVHTGDTHITVNGNADDNAMRQIRTELAQFKAELPERAVAAIATAKKQRRI